MTLTRNDVRPGQKVFLAKPVPWRDRHNLGWPGYSFADFDSDLAKLGGVVTVKTVHTSEDWIRIDDTCCADCWWFDLDWCNSLRGGVGATLSPFPPTSLIEAYYPKLENFNSIADCCGGYKKHKLGCRFMPPPSVTKPTGERLRTDTVKVGMEVVWHEKTPDGQGWDVSSACSSCKALYRSHKQLTILDVSASGNIKFLNHDLCWIAPTFFSEVITAGPKLYVPTTEPFCGTCDACAGQKTHRLGCPTKKLKLAGV